MDLSPVITRLADMTKLRQVGGAAQMPAAEEDFKRLTPPVAYVVPLLETAQQNTLGTAVSQFVAVRFAVIYALASLRDITGDAALAAMAAIRSEALAALLAWRPDPAYEPITFGGGRLLQLRDRTLWWQDDFLTAYYARKVP